MQTLELLFALQMHNLATELRCAARASFYASIFEQCDETGRKAEIARWDQDNPLAAFVPLAFQEVRKVGEQIGELARDASPAMPAHRFLAD